ncbi:MAG: molybdate ABC transporter substrate-binding protein [Rhodoferax sp.]|nr:molybdate ABC transporter substrate-binding protein [Rhodoferax sp.]MBP7491294.1 molybdate ABC transporter substrate-binding protein [Rhodoferax sp.]
MKKLTSARLLSSLVFSLAMGSVNAQELMVSAAASLTNAFKELAPLFEAKHPGSKVLLNFAASDALVQQVAKGAPVDVLACADQESMDKAETQKLLTAGSRQNFAANSLVLIVPTDSDLTIRSVADLAQASVTRIAMGNPASVPAGRYAQQALEQGKLWSAVQPKAIYALSVRQSLDYVARGEVDAGFVYNTDAAIQKNKVRVVSTVPSTVAITYPAAVIASSKNAALAQQFIDFTLSSAGQAVLGQYGFMKP